MVPKSKWIATLCAVLSWTLLSGARPADAMPYLDTSALFPEGSGVFSDTTDGNFFYFHQVYRNVSGGNVDVLTMQILMLNPEDVDGFTDINDGNRDAIVAAAEAANPGFLFSALFFTDHDVNPVTWVSADATVFHGVPDFGGDDECDNCGGTNYMLTAGSPSTALSPTLQLPAVILNAAGSNFTVTFRVHNNIFGSNPPDRNDWGELLLGVYFTPEPSTAVLLGGGLLGLVAARRRSAL